MPRILQRPLAEEIASGFSAQLILILGEDSQNAIPSDHPESVG
jgi:hypothetical protein